MPDPQQDIFDEDGQFVARVDFCWKKQRTIGEFDGKIKYRRVLKPGQSIEDVLFEEKRREDVLRDLGWRSAVNQRAVIRRNVRSAQHPVPNDASAIQVPP